ncbi:MAG: AAA family ATPase [Aestuariivita sp.]|nr:AAA family ATPase [Aestuariivita sp.]
MTSPVTLTPPCSLDSESAALGSAMQSAEHADAIASTGLMPEDCHRPAHVAVWDAVLRLRADGRAVDPVAVLDTLPDAARQRLDIGGGASDELLAMLQSAPPSSAAMDAARRVRSMAARRRMMIAGAEITRAAALAGDADAAAAACAGLLDAACASSRITPTVTLDDASDARLAAAESHADACPSGLATLDAVLGGWRPGELIVVGGSTGVGKSSLLLAMTKAAAAAGRPTLFCSMEMNADSIAERSLLADARVAAWPDTLPDGEQAAAWRAVERGIRERPERAPIHIDDAPRQTVGSIARRARSIDGLGLIAVDYLQLVTPGSTETTRATELATITRGLRALGDDLGCAVLAAAQLNRGPDSDRQRRRPRLADLRESGALEQDADAVLLMHVDEPAEPPPPTAAADRPLSQPVELRLAKSRRTAAGHVVRLLRHPGGSLAERLLA